MVDNVNDWSSRKHSPAERQWQTMTSDIEVLIVLLRYDSYPTRMLTYSRCSTKSSMLETHSRPRSSKITSTQRRTTPTSDTTTWMNKATRLPSTAPSFVYFGTQCMKTVRFVSPQYDSYRHSTFRIPIVPPLWNSRTVQHHRRRQVVQDGYDRWVQWESSHPWRPSGGIQYLL